jgi:hypothetical protein
MREDLRRDNATKAHTAPMVVVGAAFSADAARDAARAIARLPDVAPNAVARAPLGAVGRVSEGMVLVAVCVSEQTVEEVARIIDEFGGQIVSRQSYPDRGDDSPDPCAHGPIDLSGTKVPGRTVH